MPKPKRHSFREKREWVLNYLAEKWEKAVRQTVSGEIFAPRICSMEETDQQAWLNQFGGQEIVYTVGNNVVPGMARALRRMADEGDLVRHTGGNQDAKYYSQKTYYVSYKLAEKHINRGGR